MVVNIFFRQVINTFVGDILFFSFELKNLKEGKWLFFILDTIVEFLLLYFDENRLIKFLICLQLECVKEILLKKLIDNCLYDYDS